jgi:hypothetical protein
VTPFLLKPQNAKVLATGARAYGSQSLPGSVALVFGWVLAVFAFVACGLGLVILAGTSAMLWVDGTVTTGQIVSYKPVAGEPSGEDGYDVHYKYLSYSNSVKVAPSGVDGLYGRMPLPVQVTYSRNFPTVHRVAGQGPELVEVVGMMMFFGMLSFLLSRGLWSLWHTLRLRGSGLVLPARLERVEGRRVFYSWTTRSGEEFTGTSVLPPGVAPPEGSELRVLHASKSCWALL